MQTIRDYIDNIFLAFPKTDENETIKENIILDLEEKYHRLLAEGKTENDAIAIIVRDFGSAEDLARELGLSPSFAKDPKKEAEIQGVKEEYKSFRRTFAFMIAGGIGLIFLGIILSSMIARSDLAQGWTVAGFFIPLGLAIALFVIAGIKDDDYQDYFKAHGLIDGKRDEEESPRQEKINAAIMLTSLVIFLYLGFAKGLWHPGWVVFIIGAAIMNIVGAFMASDD